jgi:hypothetical protein
MRMDEINRVAVAEGPDFSCRPDVIAPVVPTIEVKNTDVESQRSEIVDLVFYEAAEPRLT